jgi:hypothetical protein
MIFVWFNCVNIPKNYRSGFGKAMYFHFYNSASFLSASSLKSRDMGLYLMRYFMEQTVRVQKSVVAFLCCCRFAPDLLPFGRDVSILIGQELWKTRGEDIWSNCYETKVLKGEIAEGEMFVASNWGKKPQNLGDNVTIVSAYSPFAPSLQPF